MTDDDLLQGIEAAVTANKLDVANELTLALKQSRMAREPLPSYKLGQEGMPDAIKATVGEQFGKPAQALAGVGSAPMVAGHAVANLAGADNDAAMQNWKSVQGATPYTQGGNIAGNVGMFSAMPAGAVGAGMGMAGRTLPRLGAVADMTATQGGLAAATTPGDASERLTAGMLGAGAMAIPGSVGAVQGARRMVTKPGKQLSIGEGLSRELGPDTDSLIAGLGGAYPGSRYGVNPTAAMLTRHPTLEVMETGSRTRTGDQWTQLDRMNAEARWKALEASAGTPQELTQLKAARDAITGPKRDDALQFTGGALKVGKGSPYGDLTETLESLATGANRPNKEVQSLVNYVKGELDKGVTPEQLYTVRKMLTDGIKAAPTSELSQAARAARPQRMEIIGKIDGMLDDLTSGRWNDYLESYKIASPLINSREAMLKIKGALEKNLPLGVVPPQMGEKVRPTALGSALRQFGEKQFGSKTFDQLLPADRQLMATMLEDMSAQAGVLSSATKMGSPTAPLSANAGRVSGITNAAIDAAGNAVPLAGNAMAASAKGSLARMNEEALADLLKSPQKLAETLRQAKAAAALLRRSGQAGAGAGAGLRSGVD